MDLDGLETVDLRALGGTDVVTVEDLSGTDLSTLDTDLAGPGGDDAVTDELVVPTGVVVGQDGPAAVVAGLGAQVRVLNGGVGDRIHVTGATASEVVSVAGTAGADTVAVSADGTDVVVAGATPGVHVRLTGVGLLDVDLAAGDDGLSAAGNLAALVTLDVDGGDGNDTIVGGNGADRLAGGAGEDFVDGGFGADLVSGGDGSDVVQWTPGGSNDTVDGGAGVDRLVFQGSGAGEVFGLSAAGGHVRLSRNVASVAMDLDGLETVDLRALGGTDVVTVEDLSGTDLSTLDTDLAGPGGAVPDGVVDEVIVNGTATDDVVGVSDDGSVVGVQGLASAVRIAGADPALDRLTVNGLEGSDAITASPGAYALILLSLLD
jgi:hypothetical protein